MQLKGLVLKVTKSHNNSFELKAFEYFKSIFKYFLNVFFRFKLYCTIGDTHESVLLTFKLIFEFYFKFK